MKLSKSYILEGHILKVGTTIEIKEDNKFNQVMLDMTDEQLATKVKPILDSLHKDGLLDSANGVQIQKDIFDFCVTTYNRDKTIPTMEDVKAYLVTRNQGFAV